MQNEDGLEKDLDIVFALVSKPSQARWPKNGALGVNGDTVESQPFFSVERARKDIAAIYDDGFISSDRAGALDACVLSHGLPMEMTRYDRIMDAFGPKDLVTAERLISIFSGATPPEPGSGAARFDLCREGAICGLPNCGRYPRHGKVYPEGITLGVDGIVFSAQRVQTTLTNGLTRGLFVPTEESRIMEQAAQSDLASGDAIYRADKLGAFTKGDHLSEMLDIVFGIAQPTQPPGIVRHIHHAHLYAVNGHEIEQGIFSDYDAELLFKASVEKGILVESDLPDLRKALAELHLPAGSEEMSPYTSGAARNALESLLNLFRQL